MQRAVVKFLHQAHLLDALVGHAGAEQPRVTVIEQRYLDRA
jgi:hypothetical protein